ncbi:AraC family transcriptional regulator [candidate division KSB1 bacterium]|nr:MAG: AraC family transcriptional regulator [candidate division KSB1 bacterium]
MTPSTFRQQQTMAEYKSRINRVLDYIDAHLDRNFTLDELAAIASFSKYHFHRIFLSFMDEPLFQFIQRIRLERAAALLSSRPDKSITEIALDCGFGGSAAFARRFREKFDMSASQWRRQYPSGLERVAAQNSNTDQMLRNQHQASLPNSPYITTELTATREDQETLNKGVDVTLLPDQTVAYVRYMGPFKGDAGLFARLFGQLTRWAKPRDLLRIPDAKFFIIVHDIPELTPDKKLRVSVCLTVPADTTVSGEIGKMTVPGGKYAMARFELRIDQYPAAWTWLFAKWLPHSGYLPDDRPSFEMYDAVAEPSGGIERVVICLPVKPL